ncbi:hypothetical protein EK21DRAFT_99170 [Setomelanomma holmii]|uniref:Uncharacterized protein n=1 Tax=Setomelanomma holmii TaxID=210430 RepID=A0A9P4HCT4_9PLEO|nr:hypothetical protein EK21DRAFT_99170 [Setomelanomma holmii]
MSSGVRNLRAMFENQGTPSSPEPRGRSPGDSTPAEPESRPTPKVRASFISVEPTGIAPPDLGTTKGTPTNSAAAHRRESFSISQDNTEEIAELKKEVSAEKEERKNSVVIPEAIPEQAVASRESSTPAPPIRNEPAGEMPTLGAIMKGSDFPEPSTTEPEKSQVKETVAQPTQAPAKKEMPARKAAAAPKTETPAPSQTPAKKESKPTGASMKDGSAQPATPAKATKKLAKALKADAPGPGPAQTPAKVESADAEVTSKTEDKPAASPAVVAPEVLEVIEQEEKPPIEVKEKAVAQPVEVAEKKIEEPVRSEVEPTAAPIATKTEEKSPVLPSTEPTTAPETHLKTENEPVAAPTIEAPSENPDKVVTGAQEEASLKPVEPVEEATASDEPVPSPAKDEQPSSSTPKPAVTPKAVETKAKTNGTPVAKARVDTKKPAAISTAKASASKAPAGRSPLPKSIPRTPTTPKAAAPATAAKASSAAVKPKPVVSKPVAAKAVPKPTATKEPVKAAPPKTSRASLRPGALSTAAAPIASAATKAKAPAAEVKKPVTAKPATTSTPASSSASGFKKPAPKSPTRPVKLPAHLTAPTAASAAKHGEEEKVTRKPSTTTRPKTTAPGTRSSRPSIAPSTTAAKRPDSRASTTGGAPKGDFLSRMMRPTAASASKTHDKPDSPPRKGTKAPVSALQKGKKKIEEVASKAKEAVTTNGHSTEAHGDKGSTNKDVPEADDSGHTEAGAVAPEEPSKTQDPVQEHDTSVAEIQTPQFSGETVR